MCGVNKAKKGCDMLQGLNLLMKELVDNGHLSAQDRVAIMKEAGITRKKSMEMLKENHQQLASAAPFVVIPAEGLALRFPVLAQ